MAQLAAQLAFDLGVAVVRDFAVEVAAAVALWLADGYARAPALIAGLAALLLVPLLAIMAMIFRGLAGLLRRPPPQPEPIRTEIASLAGLGWPCDAWIVVDGDAEERRAVPREIMSIGREDDNDLCLDHATVHRHHALLHRTPEAQFLIRDLSGRSGNGIKVNGRRVDEVALRDGDRIEIGTVALRFEARPA